MKKTIGFFALLFIFSLAFIFYYFFFLKLSVVNTLDGKNINKVVCFTSSGRKHEVTNIGFGYEVTKWIYIGNGQRLECEIMVNGYRPEKILVIGYYDWQMKKISIFIKDNKIQVTDISAETPIEIETRNLNSLTHN